MENSETFNFVYSHAIIFILRISFLFSKKNPLYVEYLKYYKATQARKKPSIYAIATINLLNSLDHLVLF